jgi:ATP-binding cassette subfamily B protein
LRIDRAVGFVWRASPGWTTISALLIVVQGLIPFATLYILKLIIDRVTAAVGHLGPSLVADEVVPLIAAGCVVTILGVLTSALLGYAQAIQSHLIVDQMQDLIHRKSLEVDLAYYENEQYFDKLHRAQREAPGRPLRIVQGLAQAGRNGLTMLGALGVLLHFNGLIVVAVFIASIPSLYFRLRHAEALHAAHREKTAAERASMYFSRVLTTTEHAKETRTFGFGPLIAQRYSDLRMKIRDRLAVVAGRGHWQHFFADSIAIIIGFSALTLIVRAAASGSITLGELVLYFGAFQVALASLRPTFGGMAELYEHTLFLSALDEFLHVSREVAEPATPVQMPRRWSGGVDIRKLSFSYPGTSVGVLHEIDLTIRPGEVVALVGRNGSGKTTLSKLLCRLYDPTSGSITIDGVDLRRFSTSDLRREIAVIHQDFGRYHMTVAENIALGSPGLKPDDARIHEAARLAGIRDTVMGLPAGFDTVLGRTLTEGTELSLGQWQKIALARALVRDTQLVLLDEPTSSLDPAAEFEFFENFRQVIAGRSALIVSHRFSTVRLADRIYVLDAGRVLEQGTHESLLRLGGLYADLFNRQASYYLDLEDRVASGEHERNRAAGARVE